MDDGDGGWWEDPDGVELPEPYKTIGAPPPSTRALWLSSLACIAVSKTTQDTQCGCQTVPGDDLLYQQHHPACESKLP